MAADDGNASSRLLVTHTKHPHPHIRKQAKTDDSEVVSQIAFLLPR